MNIIKGKGQRLIPEYLLKYLENQKENGVNITQLVDANGNPRFIEGEGTPLEQEGVTISYCKWSLSGTHLMFVCAGTIEDTTIIENSKVIASFSLPNFIFEKIYPVWADVRIETKNITFYASNWVTQSAGFTLTKRSNAVEINLTSGNFTLTANRGFRMQFDLLIDTE